MLVSSLSLLQLVPDLRSQLNCGPELSFKFEADGHKDAVQIVVFVVQAGAIVVVILVEWG